MKILITGVNGLLGHDLWEKLASEHEVYGACREGLPEYVPEKQLIKFDITKQEDTYNIITKLNPDIVIHTAALSDVDFCEKYPEKAYSVNSIGTRNICLACQRFDTEICYISTDYVFDGSNPPEDGYKEFDDKNPLNIYGKSKYIGEFYCKHLLNKFYIVRPAWLFGAKRNNFVSYIMESVKQRKTVKVVKNHVGSPTYTKDLSLAISKLIEKKSYGIFHITNSAKASREEVVNYIFSIIKDSTDVNLVEMDNVYFAKRPENSSLNNHVWKIEGFTPLRTWKEAVKEFINLNHR